MTTPRDLHDQAYEWISRRSKSDPWKTRPKRHRRETRPAIAKRYKMDGGWIRWIRWIRWMMRLYYDELWRIMLYYDVVLWCCIMMNYGVVFIECYRINLSDLRQQAYEWISRTSKSKPWKSQPKHHRRKTRPAIAKRYKIDGGCIMMMYNDDV